MSYKLIGFLVPPQKKLSPISTSKIRHVQSVVGVDDDGDGDWRLEIEDGDWRLEIGDWRLIKCEGEF